MGMTSSATFFYGYFWPSADGYEYANEGAWPAQDLYVGWEDRILLNRGELTYPYVDGGYIPGMDEAESKRLVKEWYEGHRALRGGEFIDIDVGYGGNHDFASTYVYWQPSRVSVDWCEIKPVKTWPEMHAADKVLSRWLEATNADMDGAVGPGWFVSASYG